MNAQKTGKFIQNLRKEKNMTQMELADRIHVSDKAVSRWETGKGFPDINSLEDIAEALDTSVSELLRGERFDEYVRPAEVEEITSDGLDLVRQLIERKRIRNIIIGFLLSLITVTLFISHMTAPLMISGSRNAVKVEELADGKIIAVVDSAVAGYDYTDDPATDPDTELRVAFLGCYTTRWHQMTEKNRREKVLLLGREGELDCIYYYPGSDGADELIYGENTTGSGVETLPRLVYNYWILIWGTLSVTGLAVWYRLRHKPCAGTVLKAAMIPVSLLIGHVTVLAGNFGEIYSAQFYITGILLAALLVFMLFLLVSAGWKRRA